MTDDERRTLKRFLLHLHFVLNHPAARGQTVMAAVHGMPYTGPMLDRSEIHALAGLPAELPEPEYPESEFCVQRLAAGEVMRAGEPAEKSIVMRGTAETCRSWIARRSRAEVVRALRG